MTDKQHIILCEGFEDRDFWAGWLLHLGCTDPTDRGKKKVKDAWGRTVVSGKFLFRTPGGSNIIVDHFRGRTNARRAAKIYLLGGANRPDRLVINIDSDAENGSGDGIREDGALEAIRQIVRHYGGEVASGSAGPFQLDNVQIFPVIWECDDREKPGVPGKQTLERLATAAIQAAYPDRGPVVADFLAAEPKIEVTPAKSYSYSYYAKWYSDHGVGDFFKAIWLDEAVARQLRERLEKTGSWETVVSLVED